MESYWVKFEVCEGCRIEILSEATDEDMARYMASFRIGVRFGSEIDLDKIKWIGTEKVDSTK